MRKLNNNQFRGGQANLFTITSDGNVIQHCARKTGVRSQLILVLFLIGLFLLGIPDNFAASPYDSHQTEMEWLGGGIADIYQGKTGELGVILYPDEVVTLMVKTVDGIIVVPPEEYSSPNLYAISIVDLSPGSYKLVACVGKEEENIPFTR